MDVELRRENSILISTITGLPVDVWGIVASFLCLNDVLALRCIFSSLRLAVTAHIVNEAATVVAQQGGILFPFDTMGVRRFAVFALAAKMSTRAVLSNGSLRVPSIAGSVSIRKSELRRNKCNRRMPLRDALRILEVASDKWKHLPSTFTVEVVKGVITDYLQFFLTTVNSELVGYEGILWPIRCPLMEAARISSCELAEQLGPWKCVSVNCETYFGDALGGDVFDFGAQCFCFFLRDNFFAGKYRFLSPCCVTSLELFGDGDKTRTLEFESEHFRSLLDALQLTRDNFTSLVALTIDSFPSLTTIPPSFCAGELCLRRVSITNVSNLREIGDNAFYRCSNLLQITMSGSTLLTTIPDGFAASCNALWKVSVSNTFCQKVAKIGRDFLAKCPNLLELSFDCLSSVSDIDAFFCNHCLRLAILDLPCGQLVKVGNSFCHGCTSLEQLRFPDHSFGSHTADLGSLFLSRCLSLTSLRSVFHEQFSPVLSNITHIPNGFLAFSGIEEVNLGAIFSLDKVTHVGSDFLSWMRRLKHLNLGEVWCNVEFVGELFCAGIHLSNVVVPAMPNLHELDVGFFCHSPTLRRVDARRFFQNLHCAVAIRDQFFASSDLLEEVLWVTGEDGEAQTECAFPSIRSIGHYFLANCPKLRYIDFRVFAESVKEIGDDFLANCCCLRSVTGDVNHNFELHLPKLLSIGARFLANSAAGPSLRLLELRSIQHIDAAFLQGCERLVELRIEGLAPTEYLPLVVASNFCAKCFNLRYVFVLPLPNRDCTQVATFGLFDGCEKLETTKEELGSFACVAFW